MEITKRTKRHAKITPNAYWYLSSAANRAIDEVLADDYRRVWDPREDAPSLATLQGEAGKYGGRYMRSRERLLDKAGVHVRQYYVGPQGRSVWIVTTAGEPASAAARVDRDTRELVRVS